MDTTDLVGEKLAARDAALLDQTMDGVAVIDTRGRIAYANRAALDLLGHTVDEVIGSRAMSWVHHDDRAVLVGAIRKIVEGAREARVEVRLSPDERSWRWVEALLTNSIDDANIGGITAAFRDVTRRRLAEERDALLHRTITEVVVHTDLLDAFTAFAEIARRALNFDTAFLALRRDDDFVVVAANGTRVFVPSFGKNDAFVAFVLNTDRLHLGPLPELQSATLSHLRRAGITTLAIRPLHGAGEPFGFVAFGASNPEAFAHADFALLDAMIVQAASALRMFAALEHEREAAASARTFAELRTSLLEMAAHDFATPLTVIGGLAETLARVSDELPQETRQQLLERISANTKTLAMLTVRLLDAVRADADEEVLHREPMSLVDLVREIADDVRLSTNRVVRVSSPPGIPDVIGDRVRLAEVVSNLVRNAIQHSGGDDPIDISVRAAGTEAVITVTDHGRGIPADEQEALFERFRRGASAWAAHAPKGHGLGLHIARSIVESHGGRIWVMSEPGQGATFGFTVPLAPTATPR